MSVTRFDHTSLGQRVLFDTGAAVENTAAAVESLGARRVLLVSGRSSAQAADAVSAALPVAERITEVVQHVPADRAEAAVSLARSAEADLLLTIGGGSATGLGKAVALQTSLPLVAVPTTFSGSEATDVWGLTTDGRKQTGSDPRVLPRVVVYDAALTTGLSATSAAASGLNAVAHAIDGFWAPRADPVNRALGAEGLRTLVPALRALGQGSADDDGAALSVREQMLFGAYLTAVAFASAGSGLHHKACHVLGGAFGLPHAPMHAVVLPYVTAFNAPAAPEAAGRIATALGGAPDRAATAGGAGAGPATELRELLVALGLPTSLRELGLRETDVPRAVELLLPSVPPSNPRSVDAAALTAILRAAWSGDPVESVEPVASVEPEVNRA